MLFPWYSQHSSVKLHLCCFKPSSLFSLERIYCSCSISNLIMLSLIKSEDERKYKLWIIMLDNLSSNKIRKIRLIDHCVIFHFSSFAWKLFSGSSYLINMKKKMVKDNYRFRLALFITFSQGLWRNVYVLARMIFLASSLPQQPAKIRFQTFQSPSCTLTSSSSSPTQRVVSLKLIRMALFFISLFLASSAKSSSYDLHKKMIYYVHSWHVPSQHLVTLLWKKEIKQLAYNTTVLIKKN